MIMMCGDLNARSDLRDQQDTSQQRFTQEDALINVLFTPVSTPASTYVGARQDDLEGTVGLVLVAPWLAQWRRAETLSLQGNDHLPAVYSQQKPRKEQKKKKKKKKKRKLKTSSSPRSWI